MLPKFCELSFLLAIALALAVPAQADDTLVITPTTKSYLDKYLSLRQPLAFAVSADGRYSGYVYCADYNCQRQNFRNEALSLCARGGGRSCRILAVGKSVVLEYRVGDEAASARAPCDLTVSSIGHDLGWPRLNILADECRDLRRYLSGAQLRAFASTDISGHGVAWGWSFALKSPESAGVRALAQCNKSRAEMKLVAECRLLAIGDIFVGDMDDEQLKAVNGLYRANRNATNADLPAN